MKEMRLWAGMIVKQVGHLTCIQQTQVPSLAAQWALPGMVPEHRIKNKPWAH